MCLWRPSVRSLGWPYFKKKQCLLLVFLSCAECLVWCQRGGTCRIFKVVLSLERNRVIASVLKQHVLELYALQRSTLDAHSSIFLNGTVATGNQWHFMSESTDYCPLGYCVSHLINNPVRISGLRHTWEPLNHFLTHRSAGIPALRWYLPITPILSHVKVNRRTLSGHGFNGLHKNVFTFSLSFTQ